LHTYKTTTLPSIEFWSEVEQSSPRHSQPAAQTSSQCPRPAYVRRDSGVWPNPLLLVQSRTCVSAISHLSGRTHVCISGQSNAHGITNMHTHRGRSQSVIISAAAEYPDLLRLSLISVSRVYLFVRLSRLPCHVYYRPAFSASTGLTSDLAIISILSSYVPIMPSVTHFPFLYRHSHVYISFLLMTLYDSPSLYTSRVAHRSTY
jgi:hypothetical protein